jgi:hypothetical protein
MKRVGVGGMALLLVLSACGKPSATAQAGGNASAEQIADAEDAGAMSPAEKAARNAAGKGDTADYYTKLPLNEFMPHVMQLAGDSVWKWQGYVTDKDGEHSLFPKNDEEWETAESGALLLAEMTNVLLIPGRRVPDPEWDRAAGEVRKVALKAAAAAEKHDEEGFFAAGGELDEACDVCHMRFDPKFNAGQQAN